MGTSVVGAAVACVAGVLLAALNDRLTRMVLKRNPSFLIPFFVVRQLINVSYLVALYFLSPVLPWDMAPVLIGGALGITVPSILFAARLARQNDAQNGKAKTPGSDTADGKERGQNG